VQKVSPTTYLLPVICTYLLARVHPLQTDGETDRQTDDKVYGQKATGQKATGQKAT